jgi:hypothetical protein
MNRLLKLIIAIAVVFAIWKYGLPWIQQQTSSGKHSDASAASSGNSSCTQLASAASEAWGRGLHQFVNPPYDLNAWSSFKQDVESKISSTESECSCSSESCTKVNAAMRDLRGLVSDLDSAIRSGSAPPSDAVQRQEAIDKQIDEAAELVRSGK